MTRTPDDFTRPVALTEKWVISKMDRMCTQTLSPAEFGEWIKIKEALISRRPKLKP
jgi:hypothetical protein